MPRDRNLITMPRALIAVLIVLAVFAVLVSPAPDELPGTTPHLMPHALMFAFVLLSLPNTIRSATERLAMSLPSPSPGADLLTLQCTRLC
jgi:hypothetical protein